MSGNATITLTKLDLSVLHGWANFVKFDPESEWDKDDERTRRLIYEALLPLVRNLPAATR